MSLTVKNKWLTALVLLLLLANTATLVFFWWNRGRGTGRPGPQAPPAVFLAEQLQLSPVQRERLDSLVQAHRQLSTQFRERIRLAKDSLFGLARDPHTSDSLRRERALSVSRLVMENDLATLDHFARIRALCDPVQQERFDRLIHDMLRRMGGGRPPGDGPPPPGGEGPPRPE